MPQAKKNRRAVCTLITRSGFFSALLGTSWVDFVFLVLLLSVASGGRGGGGGGRAPSSLLTKRRRHACTPGRVGHARELDNDIELYLKGTPMDATLGYTGHISKFSTIGGGGEQMQERDERQW